MPFPNQNPTETTLNTSNNAHLKRKYGRVELWRDNKIVVVEGNVNTYKEFADAIKGDVLEVGTGIGEFTQFALQQPNLTKIWTVEIEPDFVAIYNQRFGNNPKAVLVTGDIEQYITGVSKRFDLIFFDLDYFTDQFNYNLALRFAQWASNHLKANGVMITQYFLGFDEFETDASVYFTRVERRNRTIGRRDQVSHLRFYK